MIIKLIEAKAKPKEADRRAHYLTRYLATADRRWLGHEAPALDHGLTLSTYMTTHQEAVSSGERVLFKGASINGEVQTWEDGIADVERRLAKRSAKVKKPVRHGILSLREGERLTEGQCIEAVATLAVELGCEPSAILWAAHGDTDNFHLHIMFVTVDSETGGAVPFGRGPKGQAQWKEAMQRAIARIESAEDLQREAGGRYHIEGEKLVRSPTAAAIAPRKRPPIPQERLDWEAKSGFMCFTRYAQDVAGPILDDARSWTQLHADLAPHGLGIRPSVNGGELHAGDEHVKLSSVDRRHSWGKLTHADRLGSYVPPAEGVEPAPYEPRIHDPAKANRWLERNDRKRNIASAIDRRILALLAARDAALADVTAQLSVIGADIAAFDGDPRLARDLCDAMPNLRASAMAAIRAAFAGRIDAVRAMRSSVATSDDLAAVDVEAIAMPDVGLIAPWSSANVRAGPERLAGYEAEQAGDVVRYWHGGDRRRQGQPALIDAGHVIWVNDRSDDTVAAAIALAQQRFEHVAVFGDAAYLQQCAAASERLGVPITVIPVAEGQRRARATARLRDAARRRALQTWMLGKTDASVQRQRWREAFRLAMSAAVWDNDGDGTSRIDEVPHHASIPALAELSRRDAAAQAAKTPSRPRPSQDVGIG